LHATSLQGGYLASMNGNTGNIFGVVANITDVNVIKNSISIINISDYLLGIG